MVKVWFKLFQVGLHFGSVTQMRCLSAIGCSQSERMKGEYTIFVSNPEFGLILDVRT